MPVTVGAGIVIGNVAVLEVTPLGLIRVTMAAPPAASRFAGTVAVTCVALTKVVDRGKPFQRKTQLVAKLTPVAVRVNEAEPSVVKAGERAEIMGRSGSTVKVRMLETAPPGLETVTAADSAVFDMLAGTDAVNCEALRNAVASGEPFHSTVAPGTNLVPLTVRVNVATPSVAAFGLRLVRMAGAG
jgi:hypothetical protein